jgi:hypothetical protein
MLVEAIDRFNAAVPTLGVELRRAKTPGEWEEMRRNPAKRDYAGMIEAVVPLLQAFEAAPSVERVSVASRLAPNALSILRTFAAKAAALAVRVLLWRNR